MTTPLRAPAVTVRSFPCPTGGVTVEFTAAARGVPPVRVRLHDPAVVDGARALLDKKLSAIKALLPPLADCRPDDRKSPFLVELRCLGRMLVFALFGQGHAVQLETFWNDALRPYRVTGRTPLVECVGAEASMLPLEFLPLGRLGGPDVAEDRQGLRTSCEDFVGFSCLVFRELPHLRPPRAIPLRRGRHGRVPIRYLHHDGLVGGEQGWFRANAATVDLEGPYPTAANGAAPTVPAQVYDPSLLMDGRRRSLPDQILHFSCHCYAGPGVDPWDYEIHLQGEGHEVRVTLADLGSEAVRYSSDRAAGWSQPPRPVEFPLVFMNACGSSTVLLATSAMSFPGLFLGNGNRGFLGTELTIPDDVAAQFACYLYQRLLLDREQLGDAVLGARLDLLMAYGNPLGLTYSAYADPEIQLEPPSDVQVPEGEGVAS